MRLIGFAVIPALWTLASNTWPRPAPRKWRPLDESEADMMSSRLVLRTRLCDLLGIDYPVLQSGMGLIAGHAYSAPYEDLRVKAK